MGYSFGDTLFTPAVRAAQAAQGSPFAGRDLLAKDRDSDRFGPHERAFLESRDSLYMASVSESGWPYVQHRGGPAGFLKVLDARRFGFADFRGNRQYVSLGNTSTDDRVAFILVDYANRRRLKLLGHLQAIEAAADPALIAQLTVPGYGARIERAFIVALVAFDWNCPQHITPRFTEAEVAGAVAPLQAKLAALQDEVERLRAAEI